MRLPLRDGGATDCSCASATATPVPRSRSCNTGEWEHCIKFNSNNLNSMTPAGTNLLLATSHLQPCFSYYGNMVLTWSSNNPPAILSAL